MKRALVQCIALGLPLGIAAACSSPINPPNPVSARLAGKSCELFQDAQGITHIRAQEIFACWGFVHGRDRAWQMDYFRRAARGRRAEILGTDHLRSDFLLRMVGLGERAEKLFEAMTEGEREVLWAYAHGANRGIQTALADQNAAYEFNELGYQPDPWHPTDTLALMLLQSFDQTRKGFEADIKEQGRIERFGEKEVPRLFIPDELPWDVSILKSGEFSASKQSSSVGSSVGREGGGFNLEYAADLSRVLSDDTVGTGNGSNSWVVAPSRSRTGRAWLANDPHLQLKHPPFWHWSHVEGDGLNLIGASLPGVPIVVSGANQKVAWGLTNSYLDVADVHQVAEAELKNTSSGRPVIWFKFWKFPFKLPMFFKTFRRTEQGWPILPVVPVGPDAPGRATVLRWSGFDVGPADFRGLFALLRATSAKEADEAFARVGPPTWNFVFADVKGTIGYRAVGKIPRRARAPAWGLSQETMAGMSAWEYLSADQMPHVFKPARGFVVTANNRQWPKEGVFHGGRAYADGFRAFRIEELIQKNPRHDFESMKKIQCDIQSVDSRFLLPELLKHGTESPEISGLANWDRVAGLDSMACPLYRRWVDLLMAELGYDENALYRDLLKDPRLGGKTADSLVRAIKEVGGRSWGAIHRTSFLHLAGDEWFKAKSIPSRGDVHSVDPGTLRWGPDSYEHTAGASHRVIVELTDPPTVHAVLAGSNVDLPDRILSEPGSAWENWSECRQQKLLFPLKWDEVRSNSIQL